MKIIFFGTSNVALPILEVLSKKHEILAVVTGADAKVGRKQEVKESPVSVLANEMKLKVIKPDRVGVDTLSPFAPDLAVVVSYGKILPLEVINFPKFKTVNVHFSVLPKYRGPSPIQFALLNGDEYTGTSIFILDQKVDTGPILATEVLKIDPDDNFLTLSQKLAYKSAAVINQVLEDYVSGKITPLPQDDSAATFTKIIIKEDGKIDWNKTATQIYNKFRAFYPWPGVWSVLKGKKLKITDLSIASSAGSATQGQVYDGGIVACGENTAIQIKTLQLEGKSEVSISDFLNGYRDFVGSKLE